MQHNIVAGLIVGGLGLCAFIFMFVRVVLFFSHTTTTRGNDIIQVMPRPHVLTAFFENGRYFGCLRGVIVETLNAPKILPCVIHSPPLCDRWFLMGSKKHSCKNSFIRFLKQTDRFQGCMLEMVLVFYLRLSYLEWLCSRPSESEDEQRPQDCICLYLNC